MKRFKVTATRVDEYIIELDETKFNDEWKKEFGSVFHQIDKLEDVVKDLAFAQLRFGDTRFFEGYGNVLRDGKLPFSGSDYKDGKLLPADQRDEPAEGINIVIVSEDDDYDFEVEELPA